MQDIYAQKSFAQMKPKKPLITKSNKLTQGMVYKMDVLAYIIDQSHEAQISELPEGAIPGFVAEVYSANAKGKPVKKLDSKWNKTRELAEQAAQGYLDFYSLPNSH